MLTLFVEKGTEFACIQLTVFAKMSFWREAFLVFTLFILAFSRRTIAMSGTLWFSCWVICRKGTDLLVFSYRYLRRCLFGERLFQYSHCLFLLSVVELLLNIKSRKLWSIKVFCNYGDHTSKQLPTFTLIHDFDEVLLWQWF